MRVETLSLKLGTGVTAQTCTDATDGDGFAACNVVVNRLLGPGTVSATFNGDSFYEPDSDTKTTLIFANAPGGAGAFVVGDKTPKTGTVYFWGSQWATKNSLSGGAAPNGFKGYAKRPASPSCGTTWSTDPGNSAPPPNEPLSCLHGRARHRASPARPPRPSPAIR